MTGMGLLPESFPTVPFHHPHLVDFTVDSDFNSEKSISWVLRLNLEDKIKSKSVGSAGRLPSLGSETIHIKVDKGLELELGSRVIPGDLFALLPRFKGKRHHAC